MSSTLTTKENTINISRAIKAVVKIPNFANKGGFIERESETGNWCLRIPSNTSQSISEIDVYHANEEFPPDLTINDLMATDWTILLNDPTKQPSTLIN